MIHYHTHFGTRAHARKFFNQEGATGGGGESATAATETAEVPPQVVDAPSSEIVKAASDAFGDLDDVAGTKRPDFSSLGKKKEPEEKKEPEAKKPEAEAKKEPEKKEPEKKETKVEEKKEPEAKKPEETKPATEKKETPTADDDKDLDQFQPKPGTGPKVRTDIENLKGLVKEERVRRREIATERDTFKAELEALKGRTLTPEVETELKDLRSLRAAWMGENDPEIAKEFDAKVEKADASLYRFLEGKGLKKDIIDDIKAKGVGAWEHWEKVETHLGEKSLDAQKLRQLRLAYDNIEDERAAKIEEIRQDPNSFFNKKEKDDKEKAEEWGKTTASHITEHVNKHLDFFGEKKAPEGASAEVKAAVEAHNKTIGEMAERSKQLFGAAYYRDPKTIADLVMGSLRIPHLEKQIESMKTDHAAEIEEKDKRIADLEAKIAGARKAGRVTTESATVPGKEGKTAKAGVGGDAHEAFSTFFHDK